MSIHSGFLLSSSAMSIIRFGEFELDEQTLELRKNGAPTRIQQQPARVLAFLLNHRGSVVTREQIRLAADRHLPIVIHTREAEDDTFAILGEERASEVGGVFHCFTGDRAMARRALDLGFYISLAGIVTFPRALELQEVARLVPPDRLLIETDSPFLAPVPFRGKRNEPAHVARVAEMIAALRGTSVERIADAARDNFTRLFNP